MTVRSFSLSFAWSLLLPASALADSGAQCTMCTHVLKNSQTRISALKSSNSATDGALIQILNDTCNKMDDTPRDMCLEIVAADSKSFLRSIRKGETPEESCQRAGMCLTAR